MKFMFLTSISLLVITACTQQAADVLGRRSIGADLGGGLSL